MVWVRRDLQSPIVQPPCYGQEQLPLEQHVFHGDCRHLPQHYGCRHCKTKARVLSIFGIICLTEQGNDILQEPLSPPTNFISFYVTVHHIIHVWPETCLSFFLCLVTQMLCFMSLLQWDVTYYRLCLKSKKLLVSQVAKYQGGRKPGQSSFCRLAEKLCCFSLMQLFLFFLPLTSLLNIEITSTQPSCPQDQIPNSLLFTYCLYPPKMFFLSTDPLLSASCSAVGQLAQESGTPYIILHQRASEANVQTVFRRP